MIGARSAGHVQDAGAQLVPRTGRQQGKGAAAVAQAGQMFLKGKDAALAVAQALEQGIAPVAHVVVQGQEQTARVTADGVHTRIVKGQDLVGPGPGRGHQGRHPGIGIQNLHGIPAKGPPARERPVVVADRGQGPCRRLSPVKRLFLARTAAAGNTLPRCRGSRPRLRAAGQKAGGRTCPATAGTGPSPSAVRILSLRTRT